jgi:hypothetical protein
MKVNENDLEFMGGNRYRFEKPNGKYKYVLKAQCSCGKYFYTDYQKPSAYCGNVCAGSRRGRPIDYTFPEHSKEMISENLTGQKKSETTREKIRARVKGAVPVLNPAKTHYSGLLGKFGPNHPRFKHGESGGKNTLYNTHANIIQKCYNEKDKYYKYYGAKGIGICDEWRDYVVFAEWAKANGWQEDLDIHRKNPAGNYEPDNCVFLTKSDHTTEHHRMRRESK